MNLDAKAAGYIKALDPSMENIVKNGGPDALPALLMCLEFLAQKTAHTLRTRGISEAECESLARRGGMAFAALKGASEPVHSIIKIVRG